MPLFKQCSYIGCLCPVPYGQKYCEKHKVIGAKRDERVARESREAREKRRYQEKGSASQRGYTSAWRRAREGFLREHPLCAHCLAEGRYVSATDVDHIKPHKGDKTLFWDRNNWQALCHSCHSKKTAREDGGYGNPWK